MAPTPASKTASRSPSHRRAAQLAGLALTLTIALSSTRATAEALPEVVPPPPATTSYSAQVVGGHLGALALTVAVAGTVHDNFMMLYPVGAPIVHAAHGNYGRAALSLALNGGLPILGALIGYRMTSGGCADDDDYLSGLCGLEGIGMGAMIGAATALAFDAVVLARNIPAEQSLEPTRPAAVRKPSFSPSLALNRDGGLSLGLGGSF